LADRLAELFTNLDEPRLFALNLPVGPAIDWLIDAACVIMEPGDVVIDTSASYWRDTLRRFARVQHPFLFYVDVALQDGLPAGDVLVSGDAKGVALTLPLLELLPPEGGMVRAGAAGAYHFALTLRAGLATAVAQALSEARQLLEAYPNSPDTAAIAGCFWPAMAPATADAAWLLDDAIRLQASNPLLAQIPMPEMGTAVDEQREIEVPLRVGAFAYPEEII